MKNAERALSDTRGSRKRAFCLVLPTLPSKYILPSSGAIVLQASGPNGERPDSIRAFAVSRCVRSDPSGRMCGVSTPALRALARSSCTSSSAEGSTAPSRTSQTPALEVVTPLFIRDRFTLFVPSDQLKRRCHIVWRKEKRIGVAFDKAVPQPKNLPLRMLRLWARTPGTRSASFISHLSGRPLLREKGVSFMTEIPHRSAWGFSFRRPLGARAEVPRVHGADGWATSSESAAV